MPLYTAPSYLLIKWMSPIVTMNQQILLLLVRRSWSLTWEVSYVCALHPVFLVLSGSMPHILQSRKLKAGSMFGSDGAYSIISHEDTHTESAIFTFDSGLIAVPFEEVNLLRIYTFYSFDSKNLKSIFLNLLNSLHCKYTHFITHVIMYQ